MDGGPGLRLGDAEPTVAEAALVDLGAGRAEVRAGQRSAVREVVEALALEVGRRGIGHDGDTHGEHGRQADDHDRRLARLGPAARVVWTRHEAT
jgi:hypothetical protein